MDESKLKDFDNEKAVQRKEFHAKSHAMSLMKQERPRREMGRILDELRIKVRSCQLGCFE